MEQINCPHHFGVAGAFEGCMVGRDVRNCKFCDHPDKQIVEVTVTTATSWTLDCDGANSVGVTEDLDDFGNRCVAKDEGLFNSETDDMLSEAIDYIKEIEEENDYICEKLMNIPEEEEVCAENCNNLERDCVVRFLRRRIKGEV